MTDKKTKNRRLRSQSFDQAAGVDDGELRLCLRYVDDEYRGAWAWPQAAAAEEVLTFLCRIGGLTWSEVKGQLFSKLRRGPGRVGRLRECSGDLSPMGLGSRSSWSSGGCVGQRALSIFRRG
jgi:hypothetical protein